MPYTLAGLRSQTISGKCHGMQSVVTTSCCKQALSMHLYIAILLNSLMSVTAAHMSASLTALQHQELLHMPQDAVSHVQLLNWPSSASSEARSILFPEGRERKVLLINGTADDAFTFTFVPEVGRNFSEYSMAVLSGNLDVLDNTTDVELAFAESSNRVNITVSLDFHSFPGVTEISFQFWRRDETLYDSVLVNYVVAGLVIFVRHEDGKRILVSGGNRSFIVGDYTQIFTQKQYTLGIFVQYLNGSTSDNVFRNDYSENALLRLKIEDIEPRLTDFRGQFEWDTDICKLSDASWDGNDVTMREGCGLCIATNTSAKPGDSRLVFGIKLEEYRAGNLTILFTWTSFTEGTEFEDLEFVTFLSIHIHGSPPALVRLISPSNMFSADGGQDLYVEMINADNAVIESFTVDGVEKPFRVRFGSYQQFASTSDFYESAVFVTEPGHGRDLQWTIQAYRPGKTENSSVGESRNEYLEFVDRTGFLFSYDNPEVLLGEIVPSLVKEEGGELVTLFGSFHDFNMSDRTHSILFTGTPLPRALLLSSNDTMITFVAPPRLDVGTVWAYEIRVRTGVMLTRSLRLQYYANPLHIRTVVFGGSRDEANGRFVFGKCSHITIIASHHITENIEVAVQWRLVNQRDENLSLGPNASSVGQNSMMLSLPSETLADLDVEYRIIVEMVTERALGRSVVRILRTNDFVIGVTLLEIFNRSIAYPAVSLRAFVKVELPHCLNERFALKYEWEFRQEVDEVGHPIFTSNSSFDSSQSDVATNFVKLQYHPGFESSPTRDRPSVARLGRELIVPRSFLRWGGHRVSCLVTALNRTNNWTEVLQGGTSRKIQGFDTAMAFIGKSSLSSVIRYGEDLFVTNGGRDIEVYGSRSYDPDELTSDGVAGLVYNWDCELSYFSDMQDAESCNQDLMPEHLKSNISFVLKSISLLEAKSEAPVNATSMFLRFALTVSKDTRSSLSYFIIELTCKPWINALPMTEYGYERMYAGVALSYGNGKGVVQAHVHFWEDIIITPLILPEYGENVTWRFELIEPRHERNKLFVDGKMFTAPFYYPASACGCGEYQNFPLGIQAGALSPHSTYIFKLFLLYLSGNGDRKEFFVEFRIKTKELPKLVHQVYGSTRVGLDTLFYAHSLINAADFSSYIFQYYLTDVNGDAAEQCLDGCTGGHIAVFRVNVVGSFILQARLFSADGARMLDAWNSSGPTEISANSQVSFAEYHEAVLRDYYIGDDGNVVLRANMLAGAMTSTTVLGTSVVESDVLYQFCEIYAPDWIGLIHNIVGKLLPVSEHIRYNIRVAANFARLKCLESENTIYGLLQIVDMSIERALRENSLQSAELRASFRPWRNGNASFDVVQDLACFYNRTISRAISIVISRGTSRSRLAPVEGYVSNLMIDLFEKLKAHIILASSSYQSCGWTRAVNSGIDDGVSEAEFGVNENGYENTLGISQIKVSVFCRAEDGLNLRGLYSNFEWCGAMYHSRVSRSAEYDSYSTFGERQIFSLYEVYDYVYLSGIQGQNRTDSKRLVDIDITYLNDTSYKLISASAVNAQMFANLGSACFQLGMEMDDDASQQLLLERSILESRLGSSSSIAKTSSENSSGQISADSCRFNVFTLLPMKEYGSNYIEPFQGDAYFRRDSGILEIDELSNGSYVTIQTENLGLFGAVRLSCLQGLQAGSMDVTGVLLSLAGLIICILLLVLIVTAITYLLATTIVAGAEESDYDDPAVEYFVDRDIFGRGHAQPPNKDAMNDIVNAVAQERNNMETANSEAVVVG